jgi:LPXTG-motif cell wall-anchored protein
VNFAYHTGEIVRRFWGISSSAVLAAAIAGAVVLLPAAAASAAPVSSGGGTATALRPGPPPPPPPHMFTVHSVHPDKGSTKGGFQLTLEGDGFKPRPISVTICGVTFSSDRGGVQVDRDGKRATFTAPRCRAGWTTIVVKSGDSTRTVRFLYVRGKLPVTGPASTILIVGASMIALGALMVLLFRRRPIARPRLS